MGNVLEPGLQNGPSPPDLVPADFANTLASTIENALLQLFLNDGLNKFDIDTNSREARDRRRILIAIAHGVVRHLVDNAGAFQVTGTDSLGQPISASLSINPGGTLLSNI
jgi:hypothetical protein